MMSYRYAVLTLAMLLAGCAGGSPSAIEVPPGSPSFRTGFINGCDFGRANANPYSHSSKGGIDTNSDRYRNDLDYRTGFDRGNKACYQDERNTPRVPSGAG